nr:LysR family transcriptional regulator [Gordonia desulfuricans]
MGGVTTLDIVPLRSFDAVVAFSSVRCAAQALHLSQPAVSGHLRRLERQLGAALVMPQGRGITLTGDGELLATYARSILELHDEAVHALTPAADGELIVAASEHAADGLVPSLVSALRAELPDVLVRLRLTRSARAREMLHDSRADIAVTLTSHAQGGEKVATVPLEWLGVPGAPTDRVILFERPCAVRDQAVASRRAADFQIVRECSNLTAVVSAVRHREGITPLPRIGARPDGLERVRDLPPLPPVPLYLATGPRVPAAVRAAVTRRIRSVLPPQDVIANS